MSLNRTTVIGNLGGDPVSRNLPSGQPAVGFSIATDESFTDKQGKKLDLTVRVTDVYKKAQGRWSIVHEHVSVPVDLDSGKPDLSSKP